MKDEAATPAPADAGPDVPRRVPAVSLEAQEGIRAIASLAVVVGHMLQFWFGQGKDYPLFPLDYLSAVTIFFLLSGFALVAVYDRDPPADGGANSSAINSVPLLADAETALGPSAVLSGSAVLSAPASAPSAPATPLSTSSEFRSFLVKRVARLAPMYFLGLVVGLPQLLVYTTSTFDLATQISLSLVGLQSLTILGIGWDAPLWTVSAFVGCYLLFPYFLRRFQPMSATQLWMQGLLVYALSIVFGAVTVMLWRSLVVAHLWFPVRLHHFVLGVLAGKLAKRGVFARPTLVAETCTALLVVHLVVCAVVCWGDAGLWSVYSVIAEFVLAPLFAVWIIALASPACTGLTRRVLRWSPLALVGQWSYAMYCLHYPLLSLCAWAVKGEGVNADAVPLTTRQDVDGWFVFSSGWYILPLLAVILAVSAIAFYAVEKPARKLIRGDR